MCALFFLGLTTGYGLNDFGTAIQASAGIGGMESFGAAPGADVNGVGRLDGCDVHPFHLCFLFILKA